MNTDNLNFLQKVLVYTGIFLIGLSLVTFLSVILGIFTFQEFEFFGHSGLRSIAAVAVLGCLSAAIGFLDE
jgi:hypothetical protein